MSLFEMLLKTYDNNIHKVGVYEDNLALAPSYHMIENVNLEITINEFGEFVSAHTFEKKGLPVLIPITSTSIGKTNEKQITPRPLVEELQYIAGDYTKYQKDVDDEQKIIVAHKKYIEQLEKWCKSTYSNIKIESIYKYLIKDCLIDDLISKAGIFKLNTDGNIENSYGKMKVVFRVNVVGDLKDSAIWKDKELMDLYIKFYEEGNIDANQNKDICYITGKYEIISLKQPQGIDPLKTKAKLISGNDKEGFTYRGRFSDSLQAKNISFEASMKIYNTLQWLIKKQGFYIGIEDVKVPKRTVLCWSSQNINLNEIVDIFDEQIEVEEINIDITRADYRNKILNILNGKRDDFKDEDDVIIVTFDAATDGRLAITYYDEMMAGYFFKSICSWNESCSWYLRIGSKYKFKSPSIKMIAMYAFGILKEQKSKQRGDNKKFKIEVNDKCIKSEYQNLLYCIFHNRPIPREIVKALYTKASNRQKYKNKSYYENLLWITCAVIAKYYSYIGGDEYMKTQLNENLQDRSYQFGRLLAIFEKIETDTYDKEENARETNAERMQATFTSRPMITFKRLQEKIEPYYKKIDLKQKKYYKKLISEIVAQLMEIVSTDNIEELNRPLEPTYLIGYYLQRKELYTPHKDNKKENKELPV